MIAEKYVNDPIGLSQKKAYFFEMPKDRHGDLA